MAYEDYWHMMEISCHATMTGREAQIILQRLPEHTEVAFCDSRFLPDGESEATLYASARDKISAAAAKDPRSACRIDLTLAEALVTYQTMRRLVILKQYQSLFNPWFEICKAWSRAISMILKEVTDDDRKLILGTIKFHVENLESDRSCADRSSTQE